MKRYFQNIFENARPNFRKITSLRKLFTPP